MTEFLGSIDRVDRIDPFDGAPAGAQRAKPNPLNWRVSERPDPTDRGTLDVVAHLCLVVENAERPLRGADGGFGEEVESTRVCSATTGDQAVLSSLVNVVGGHDGRGALALRLGPSEQWGDYTGQDALSVSLVNAGVRRDPGGVRGMPIRESNYDYGFAEENVYNRFFPSSGSGRDPRGNIAESPYVQQILNPVLLFNFESGPSTPGQAAAAAAGGAAAAVSSVTNLGDGTQVITVDFGVPVRPIRRNLIPEERAQATRNQAGGQAPSRRRAQRSGEPAETNFGRMRDMAALGYVVGAGVLERDELHRVAYQTVTRAQLEEREPRTRTPNAYGLLSSLLCPEAGVGHYFRAPDGTPVRPAVLKTTAQFAMGPVYVDDAGDPRGIASGPLAFRDIDATPIRAPQVEDPEADDAFLLIKGYLAHDSGNLGAGNTLDGPTTGEWVVVVGVNSSLPNRRRDTDGSTADPRRPPPPFPPDPEPPPPEEEEEDEEDEEEEDEEREDEPPDTAGTPIFVPGPEVIDPSPFPGEPLGPFRPRRRSPRRGRFGPTDGTGRPTTEGGDTQPVGGGGSAGQGGESGGGGDDGGGDEKQAGTDGTAVGFPGACGEHPPVEVGKEGGDTTRQRDTPPGGGGGGVDGGDGGDAVDEGEGGDIPIPPRRPLGTPDRPFDPSGGSLLVSPGDDLFIAGRNVTAGRGLIPGNNPRLRPLAGPSKTSTMPIMLPGETGSPAYMDDLLVANFAALAATHAGWVGLTSGDNTHLASGLHAVAGNRSDPRAPQGHHLDHHLIAATGHTEVVQRHASVRHRSVIEARPEASVRATGAVLHLERVHRGGGQIDDLRPMILFGLNDQARSIRDAGKLQGDLWSDDERRAFADAKRRLQGSAVRAVRVSGEAQHPFEVGQATRQATADLTDVFVRVRNAEAEHGDTQPGALEVYRGLALREGFGTVSSVYEIKITPQALTADRAVDMEDKAGTVKLKEQTQTAITNADTPYAPVSTDETILVSLADGNVNIDLPATADFGEGRRLSIKRTDTGTTNFLSIDAPGGGDIDGEATWTSYTDLASITLECRASDVWAVIHENGAWIHNNRRDNEEISSYTTTGAMSTRDYFAKCDSSGGAFTLTILSAAKGLTQSRPLRIMKTDSSGNAVTIDVEDADTINGATTQALSSQYDTITVVSDGTEWWIV